MTSSEKSFMLVTSRNATTDAVGTALASSGIDAAPRMCRDLTELSATLGQAPAPVAVVDLDPDPARSIELLEPIIAQNPATRFVVITDDFSPERMLAAINAGARHFVPKAAMATQLPDLLRKLMYANGHAHGGPAGAAITVLSAGGGCGATTLAVNLAMELPLEANQSTLIIDLDVAYGAVSTYLGITGEYGIAEALASPSGIDSQLIRSTAVKYSDQLHALLSPASIDFASPTAMRWDRISAAVNACRHAYRWVVIDAPRVPIDVAAELGRMSHSALIVGQLAVKDVRAARSIRNALIDHGVPSTHVRYVINRYRSKRQMLSLDDAQSAWGNCEIDLARNDFHAAADSINVGQPLAVSAPRSGLRRDIQLMAESLSKTARTNGYAGAH